MGATKTNEFVMTKIFFNGSKNNVNINTIWQTKLDSTRSYLQIKQPYFRKCRIPYGIL